MSQTREGLRGHRQLKLVEHKASEMSALIAAWISSATLKGQT